MPDRLELRDSESVFARARGLGLSNRPFLAAPSSLARFDVALPLGCILEEGEQGDGRVVVAEVAAGSSAAAAGVRAGDVLRATSAVRPQMEMPTWQLLLGGIGQPKLFRCRARTRPRPRG